MKGIDIQVWEAQRVPNKLDRNRTTPRHIIVKMPKVKERLLKAAREKNLVPDGWQMGVRRRRMGEGIKKYK